MKKLAPEIFRQRLILEGYSKNKIIPSQIKDYLHKLSDVLDMTIVYGPKTHFVESYGWAGYVHWIESGAHMYSFEYSTIPHFFSVDIYTCKPFDTQLAYEFTEEYFNTSQLEYIEI